MAFDLPVVPAVGALVGISSTALASFWRREDERVTLPPRAMTGLGLLVLVLGFDCKVVLIFVFEVFDAEGREDTAKESFGKRLALNGVFGCEGG